VGANALKMVLRSQYSDRMVEENGKWFVKDGENATELTAAVDSFLNSPDGSVFVPPASNVQGSGSKSGNHEQKDKPKDFATLIEESLSKK
jgi:hypothetical protein